MLYGTLFKKWRREKRMTHTKGITFLITMLWLLWMGVIFYLSSLPGGAVYYEPPFWLVLERKGAHVVEYALLYLLSFLVLRRWFTKENLRRVAWAAVLWVGVFAVTDELHQYFTPFRGAYIRDLAYDFLGIFLCLLVVMIYYFVRYKKTPK
jgi:VanZ family protein